MYRESNVSDCKNIGCAKVEILRSYYLKERNFPMDKGKIELQVPEILFLGHYEADNRREYLELLSKSGVKIGLPNSWRGKIDPENIEFLNDTSTHYNEMLNATKIAIVFLSSINKDTYTRRCFEIPATKTLMLSVYTDDLAGMFEENKEAVYFRTKEEFVEKVKYYLAHDNEREIIGEAGYRRVIRDGHEISDRAEQIIEVYTSVNEGKDK